MATAENNPLESRPTAPSLPERERIVWNLRTLAAKLTTDENV